MKLYVVRLEWESYFVRDKFLEEEIIDMVLDRLLKS